MAISAERDRSRKESYREAILNRRMLICVFTGFTSGLPLFLLFQLIPGWLAMEGVGIKEIGFFALVQFPYTWKFFWPPVMDRFTLPFLGHRRGWIIKDAGEGRLRASYHARTHMAAVAIVYNEQTFSIEYLDSNRLGYDGQSIHRNYNRWVRNLELDILRNLALLGVTKG